MHPFLTPLLLFLGAYFLGCLNTGYYLVRILHRKDLREHYSGSAGARNASRILGRWGFAVVIAGDAGKGALAMACGYALIGSGPYSALMPWLIPCAVAGSIWPVQLGFKGGKGLSTAAGTFLVANFWVVVGFLAANFAAKYLFRSKRAGLIAAFGIVPLLAFLLLGKEWLGASLTTSALFAYAHRDHLAPGRAHAPEPEPATGTGTPEDPA